MLNERENRNLGGKFLSPKVADSDIILSRCGGIVCWASHICWQVLTEGRWAVDNFLFVHHLVVAQAFVGQLVQLVRPETSLTQRGDFESEVCGSEGRSVARSKSIVRPDVLMAAADIYTSQRKYEALAECEQELARGRFQVFAGFQGATMDSAGHTYPCWSQHDTCLRIWKKQLILWVFYADVMVLSGSICQPWGAQCIFQRCEAAFKLWWASNPGAMTHLLACWIKHSSLDRRMQLAMLGITDLVFRCLEGGPLHVKQMLAAEVMRLEAESDDESVLKAASEVSRRFPKIRALNTER